MDLIKILFAGILQGLTEFLPVSSSGHLVLLQEALNLNMDRMSVTVFMHAGTLLSVIVVFRRDIINLLKGFANTFTRKKDSGGYGRLAWLIIAANIPAGVAGILFKDDLERFFSNVTYVYVFLIITGVYLMLNLLADKPGEKAPDVSLGRALLIGISQMFAILPGISRSGMTITTGILLGIKRGEAARFSFLLMLPAVAGATLLEFSGLKTVSPDYTVIFAGIAASFITGYIAIKILLKIVVSGKLHYFAYYCIAAGLAGLLFFQP